MIMRDRTGRWALLRAGVEQWAKVAKLAPGQPVFRAVDQRQNIALTDRSVSRIIRACANSCCCGARARLRLTSSSNGSRGTVLELATRRQQPRPTSPAIAFRSTRATSRQRWCNATFAKPTHGRMAVSKAFGREQVEVKTMGGPRPIRKTLPATVAPRGSARRLSRHRCARPTARLRLWCRWRGAVRSARRTDAARKP
jgi:hypothetical protein